MTVQPGAQHNPAAGRLAARGLRGGLGLLFGLLALGGCEAAESSLQGLPTAVAAAAENKPQEASMWMTVGERRFAITLADNEATRAFAAMLPLTLDMTDLHGNEKYADLPETLPTQASRPGTIHSGDLMLFGSKTLVVFYRTFDTSYSYTRLGRVDDPEGLAQALGRGGTRIEFSNN